MFKLLLFLSFAAIAASMPATQNEGLLESAVRSIRDCLDGDLVLCLKEKVLSYTDALVEKKEVQLVDGVELVSTSTKRSARSYDPLPIDKVERESSIDKRIVDNLQEFVDTHVLQLSMPRSFTDDSGTGLEEEGRGKKKKKLKKLLPLLAIFKLKIAALIPLFLGIIAFSVFKAYILGKIAFLFAAAGVIKKLIQSKKSSGWSEQSSHDEGWDSSGGWGRSHEIAQNLAYAAHVKNN